LSEDRILEAFVGAAMERPAATLQRVALHDASPKRLRTIEQQRGFVEGIDSGQERTKVEREKAKRLRAKIAHCRMRARLTSELPLLDSTDADVTRLTVRFADGDGPQSDT
jgi:hypothetical protein